MSNKYSGTLKNTIMLYIMSFVKLVLPLITLPYLTRVLSQETYGVVTYVKACMTYMQIIIDFGFILSSVKDIVNAKGNKEEIGLIVGHTYLAKTILVVVAFLAMLIMCICIPILNNNMIYVLLCFIAVAASAYLADFLFRGIEKMHIITIIFLIMKSLTTILTFIAVKDDSDLLYIPCLDIMGNIISIVLGWICAGKLGIKFRINNFRIVFAMLKDSFTYFISSMATTVFSALNTVLIGIVITDLQQIAYWGLCMQIISAIQGLYAPINNGIYPHMIREKNLNFIHRILLIMMPMVTLGCILCILLSKFVLGIIGGEEYIVAHNLFRTLVPILFFSFPAQLYGWPTLGAVEMVKETTTSTVSAACFQIIGLVILMITGTMTIYTIAILKCTVEAFLMIMRMVFVYRNKQKFNS